MKRHLLGMLAFLFALAWSGLGWGARWLERYEVTVEPKAGGDLGHITLKLLYGGQGDNKKGFKFVGFRTPQDPKATSGAGTPLFVLRADGYREQRIEWGVPPPDDNGLREVVVTFDQALDRRYHWGRATLRLPWAHKFQILVNTMTASTVFAGRSNAPGCRREGDKTRCTQKMADRFEIQALPLGAVDEMAGLIGSATLLLGFAGLLAFLLRRRHDDLLLTKGVLPPQAPIAWEAPGNYRAPPPLPRPDQRVPRLPDDERRAFWKVVAISAAMVIWPGALSALALGGWSTWPMSILLAVAIVPGGLAGTCHAWLDVKRAALWVTLGELFALLTLWVVAAGVPMLLREAGALELTLIGIGVLIFAVFVILMGLYGPKGSGSSSSSSSSSYDYSSSSSFSSCGGGGGGGGCGGCGG